MSTTAVRPATWAVDPMHTDVTFAVRHMGLSTVRGTFGDVSGHVSTDESGAPTDIRVAIDVASIRTGSDDRDQHLRSADFFAADDHPTITFESSTVRQLGDGTYEIDGHLAMHGVAKPVTLEAEIGEAIQDPFGLTRRAATARTKINRKEWGLTWNQVLEAGALLVSEEVRIELDVQVTRQDD